MALTLIIHLMFGIRYGQIPPKAAKFVERGGESIIHITMPEKVWKKLKATVKYTKVRNSPVSLLKTRLGTFWNKETLEEVKVEAVYKDKKVSELFVSHSLIKPNLPIEEAMSLISGSAAKKMH
jgi:hypothetical protein